MKHRAAPQFWKCFDGLPEPVRALARRNFDLLKNDPNHPSLHFKKIGKYRSVRVGLHPRAVEIPAGLLWFWIGSHADYDRLLR